MWDLVTARFEPRGGNPVNARGVLRLRPGIQDHATLRISCRQLLFEPPRERRHSIGIDNGARRFLTLDEYFSHHGGLMIVQQLQNGIEEDEGASAVAPAPGANVFAQPAALDLEPNE